MRASRFFTVTVTVIVAGLSSLIGPARAEKAPADASALSWMAGTWTGTKDGVEMEELWLPPKGSTLLSLHRDVREGKTISFEFLRIAVEAEGLTYWASPEGRPATPFRCVELGDRRVVFENAQHDFPRRILYWLEAGGALHAKIEGTIKGQQASEEWSWRRSAAN
jgi:uncharacterized protein DUF6265